MEKTTAAGGAIPVCSVELSRSDRPGLFIMAEVYIDVSDGVCLLEFSRGTVNGELLGRASSADYRWFEAEDKPRALALLIAELYPAEEDYRAWLELYEIPNDEEPAWRDMILLLLISERCGGKHAFSSWLDRNGIRNESYWH